jgi:hypothetical protein
MYIHEAHEQIFDFLKLSHESETNGGSPHQGCQIFLGKTYQNWGKRSKRPFKRLPKCFKIGIFWYENKPSGIPAPTCVSMFQSAALEYVKNKTRTRNTTMPEKI